MNNNVGIGLFGTFGSNATFEQLFPNTPAYPHSLALNDNIIEIHPGSDLYSISRTIIDNKHYIACCKYTYVHLPLADNATTYLGTAVVLQDAFLEAEYIVSLLQAIHESVISTPSNVIEGTLVARTARDLSTQIPDAFVAAKANAIPLGKTPFAFPLSPNGKSEIIFSSATNEKDNRHQQVVEFFDRAIKHPQSSPNQYLTFDSQTADFAKQSDTAIVTAWSSFAAVEQASQEQVIRTKKEINKPPVPADLPVDGIIVSTSFPAGVHEAATTAYKPAEMEMDEDPYKPFDLWAASTTNETWDASEVQKRIKEYNRLFQYTNSLIAKMAEGPGIDKSAQKQKRIAVGVLIFVVALTVFMLLYRFTGSSNAGAEPDNAPVSSGIATPDDATTTDYNTQDNISDTGSAQSSVFGADTLARGADAPIVSPQVAPSNITSATTLPAVRSVPHNSVTPTPRIYVQAKNLNPTPNSSLNASNFTTGQRSQFTNRTLPEITRMLFEMQPSTIGGVYRGQEVAYAATLLRNNASLFQLRDTEYVCVGDMAGMIIPAYKSPHLPVVAPK